MQALSGNKVLSKAGLPHVRDVCTELQSRKFGIVEKDGSQDFFIIDVETLKKNLSELKIDPTVCIIHFLFLDASTHLYTVGGKLRVEIF